jgi:hypothetical protein
VVLESELLGGLIRPQDPDRVSALLGLGIAVTSVMSSLPMPVAMANGPMKDE